MSYRQEKPPGILWTGLLLVIITYTIEESTQRERINQGDDADTQLATELAELKAQIATVEYLLEKQAKAKRAQGTRPTEGRDR